MWRTFQRRVLMKSAWKMQSCSSRKTIPTISLWKILRTVFIFQRASAADSLSAPSLSHLLNIWQDSEYYRHAILWSRVRETTNPFLILQVSSDLIRLAISTNSSGNTLAVHPRSFVRNQKPNEEISSHRSACLFHIFNSFVSHINFRIQQICPYRGTLLFRVLLLPFCKG